MKTIKSYAINFCTSAILMLLMLLATNNELNAQLSLSTVPPLNGGNGAGGISFNVTATNAVVVTGLMSTIYGSAAGPFEIWYNTTPINGAPSVTVANGWILAATGSVTPGGTGTTNNPPVTLPAILNIPMPAGSTYGFFINTFSTSPNTAYTTWSALNQETFTDGNITIFTGTNVGYGGPGPNPTFHPRQFNGTVLYSLSSQAPNDGGVTEILEPISFCANQEVPLIATVRNFGTEQLDSCLVVWDVNGNLDSAWFNVALDTFGGTGNIDTTIFIDSINPGSAALNLAVYTKWPNGVADTVNANDTTTLFIAGPALNGTYTIGSSVSANYATINAAVADLNSSGVCGPVIFEIEDGTYNEQFTINAVQGTSTVNTVTFRSQSGDSSTVTLTTAAATTTVPGIANLNGADYIRFHQLTFQNTSTFYDAGISYLNGSDSLIISNCRFIGNYNSTSLYASLIFSNGGNDQGTKIMNNLFEGSGFGTYIYGASTTSLESGLILENNRFINQYYHAVRLYYLDAPKVKNNFITSNSNYTVGAGLYMLYCDNAMEVSGNHIVTDPTSPTPWPYYGIYLSLCDGAGLTNTGRIFNNRSIVGADTSVANSSVFYSLFLSSCNAQRIVNNTLTVMNGGTSARAYYQSASDLIFLKNNLMTTYAPSQAAYFVSGIAVDINRNNYYAPNGQDIYYQGPTYTVEAFANATGYDLNSLGVNPQWSDIYQGYLCNDSLDGLASPISYITTDYSGFPRSANNPDPGAVEFIGVNNFTLGADDTICGNTLTLEVSGATNNLTWFVNGTPSNNNTVILENAGTTPQTYNVNVAFSSAQGCGSALDDAVFVLVPNAELDSNVHLCDGETEMLNAGGGPLATYLWSPTGETSANISITNSGLYSVTKSELGCESSSSTIVTQSNGVQILDAEICEEDMPISIDGSILNGTSYNWSGGATPNSASNTFNDGGTYTITAIDAFGCESIDTFSIEILTEPDVQISHTHVANFYSFSSANSTGVGSNGSYFWNFGDGNTSTDPNPQHAYAWNGEAQNFTVSLTISNDCGSNQSSTIVGVDPLGVNGLSDQHIEIFPNPAKTQLNIVANAVWNNAMIIVYDLGGRIVLNTNMQSANQASLDISSLAPGVYSLQLINDGFIKQVSFIKQ